MHSPARPAGSPSLLFGTPTRDIKPMPTSRFATQARTPHSPPPQGAGYLVFPHGSTAASLSSKIRVRRLLPSRREEEAERQRQAQLDEAYARVSYAMPPCARRASRWRPRRHGRARSTGSAAAASCATPRANRDYAKTDAIREELRISGLERVLVERWASYESRWADLVKAGRERPQTKDVRFEDVPWPVCPAEGQSAVRGFLLAGLTVRGCAVTKKERVRSSLLRWHPDKMTAVLARVADADVEAVQRGINVIVLCLQQLNSRVDSTCALASFVGHASFALRYSATQVNATRTGTSTSGPIVAANASSDPTPYVAIDTAIASSCTHYKRCLCLNSNQSLTKLLLPAVKACTTAIS
ncbi:hypothetical protein B0H15DRAFT_825944 [Mycena belliarum]|uniref:Uncharacterized protein n=1 Tax=Mycena belliarum TaxID=1033014 RepID=A0AAD6UB85_9AGAR|nr:hypothetical protein B0H15DRAFT_825944 [Mycena belliae]